MSSSKPFITAASAETDDAHAPSPVLLTPSHAVLLPTVQLERIFLGLGWRDGRPDQTVDVDCACVGYDQRGLRDEVSTVWYGNLRNGVRSRGSRGSSIVHTGDILTGQHGGGPLIDQERIYVWLTDLPEHIETLAFAVDVYTEGLTFSALSSFYIRLVNADTGQELARLELVDESLQHWIGEARVALLAKLQRVSTPNASLWSLDATAQRRERTLREEVGVQPDMAVVQGESGIVSVTGEMYPAGAEPVGVPVAIAVAQPVPDATPTTPLRPVEPTPAYAAQGMEPMPDAGVGSVGSGRARFACPPLAVATAAGVAAATAIFLTSEASPLTTGMLAPELFSAGVDFAALTPVDLGGIELDGVAGDMGDAGDATCDPLGCGCDGGCDDCEIGEGLGGCLCGLLGAFCEV